MSITFYHRGGKSAMDILELENKVAQLRARPLQMICLTKRGEKRVMTVRQCVESKAKYLHIVADELDILLVRELGGDNERI